MVLMPRRGGCAGVCVAAVLLLTTSSGAAAATFPGAPGAGPAIAPAPAAGVVPGEVIVRFKEDDLLARRAARVGGRIQRRLDLPGVVTLRVDPDEDVEALAAELERRPDVVWAEPNYKLQLQAAPNDPRMAELWGMHNFGQGVRGLLGTNDVDANVTEAWDFITGGDTVVAVADSGVAMNHPDLADNIWNNPGETGADAQGRDKRTNGMDDDGNSRVDDWRGWDFHNNDNDPSDDNGHGTHVAGTIGAVGNNAQGVAGVNWRVKIMPLKIGSNSRTDSSINADAAAAAMLYAGSKGVKVFNGSFGGPNPTKVQEDAIAANPGTLYVLAAGNNKSDNDQKPSYPCNFNRPNIICVASINNQGAISDFSNFGVRSVDLGAPGSSVLSTAPFTFVLDDPFEEPLAGRYTIGAPSGRTPAPWGVAPSPAGDGTKALVINNYKGMPSNSSSWVVSPPIDLASCIEPVYEVKLGAVFSNGVVDVAITDMPGNTATYTSLGQASLLETQTVEFDLTKVDSNGDGTPDRSYAGKTVNIVIGAFTGAGETGPGPNVEEAKVSCKPNVFTGQEFQFLSGTSMASPMVAGAAALVASQFPGATMDYLRSAILGSVTPTPSLVSKTVTGGRLNVLNALDTQPPGAAGLRTPADGLATRDPRPVFSWDGTTDAKTGIRGYELVVDGGAVAATDANGRSAQPGGPLPVGVHTWRVDAIDGAGLRTSSPTRTVVIKAPRDTTRPRLRLAKVLRTSRAKLARSGFRLECRLGERGTCTARVSVSRADARRLRLKVKRGAKSFTIASGRVTVGASGKATLRAKPKKKVAAAMRKARRKVTYRISVVGRDLAGNRTTRIVKVRA